MIIIQKRMGEGDWVYWDEQVTVEVAIETVKNYALGDECAFRVIERTDDGDLVAFEWGPLRLVQPEVVDE